MCKEALKLTVEQLNDIISLAVGLWAVKAAQKTSTDQFSFGVGIASSC
jgi:Co/Zn/Cd efflux system component